jgi:hypothetical protein
MHDHILLSQFRDSHNLEDQTPIQISPSYTLRHFRDILWRDAGWRPSWMIAIISRCLAIFEMLIPVVCPVRPENNVMRWEVNCDHWAISQTDRLCWNWRRKHCVVYISCQLR